MENQSGDFCTFRAAQEEEEEVEQSQSQEPRHE